MTYFLSLRLPNQFSKRWGLALLGIISAIAVVIFNGCGAFSRGAAPSPNILVDQFGYRPADAKVAVIQQANAMPTDEPALYQHLSDPFQVVRLGDTEEVVFTAPAELWAAGQIHDQSGDRAAWFDFSAVQGPGEYVIRNARTGESSVPFAIAEDVYRDVLTAATRMYYYQRSGFRKAPPHADPRWTDAPAFLGPGQDTEARFVNDKDNAALERDLRGGWFDAGDTNKYVTFASFPIHELLSAYTQNPAVWTDDFNIPESGNQIPDLLDELRYELDWFQRMQDSDGGVFIKLGTLDHHEARIPSRDRRPRFYGPKCSSSTIALASTFAHAALVFQEFPDLQATANTLQARSRVAWDWFLNHPIQTDCDTQEIQAGDADRTPTEQVQLAVMAAAYLSRLDDDPQFHDYIRQHYRETRPFMDQVGVLYATPLIDALRFYSQAPTTPTDQQQEIAEALTALFTAQLAPLFDEPQGRDPYRAWMPDDQYHWGSNAAKSNYGYATVVRQALAADASDADRYAEQALGYLHYLHGVNPLGIVYLTNMYDYDAEFSANEMFHAWLGRGIYDNAKTSPSGPAPGYVTGGPNKNYTGPVTELTDRPPMRAYLDKNDADLRMWEITEPSITYQSAYIQLLQHFL